MNFFLPAGWLVDITGSYTSTFLLSGVAMLASAFTLSLLAAIRRCRAAINQKSLPLNMSNESNTFDAFTKEMACQSNTS